MAKRVMVFGSFIVDLMGRAPHLPAPGETVKGSFFKMGAGGKGFNQGVAAHKAGAEVLMVTKVGRDSFADVATEMMAQLKMDPSGLLYSDTEQTGTAIIMVDEGTAQNQIVVVPGACGCVNDADIAAVRGLLDDCGYLVTQLETNVDAAVKMMELAHESGVKIILNPAPAHPLDDALLAKVDYITPNEIEAEILTGIPVTNEENAALAAGWFFARGVKQVLITLGSRGVFAATPEKQMLLPAFRVQAVDTTGAGDAFNGSFAAALAQGSDLWDAVRFANAAASIAVQRIGAAQSSPVRSEIEALLAQNR